MATLPPAPAALLSAALSVLSPPTPVSLRHRQDTLYSLLEIRPNLSYHRTTLTKTALLARCCERSRTLFGSSDSTLRYRDLRHFDLSDSYESTILPRRLCTLVRIPSFQALVLHDKLYLVTPPDETLMTFISNMSTLPDSQFQIRALEALFLTSTQILTDQLNELLSSKLSTSRIDDLMPPRLRCNRLLLQTRNFFEALSTLVRDEMGTVAFSQMLVNPMRFADLEDVPSCESLEVMIEVAMDSVSTILTHVVQLEQTLESMTFFHGTHLLMIQNRIYYVQIVLQSITGACSLPLFITGACAMNLSNGFGNVPITWFWLVFALSFFMLFALPPLIIYVARRVTIRNLS